MEPLPETPQTINVQLRQLPAYQAILAPAPVAEVTPLAASRVVASLMQVKDTMPMLLLLSNGELLLGFCLFNTPGLVLYGLRWRQVWGRAGRRTIVTQAALSLLNELFWVVISLSAAVWIDATVLCQTLATFYGLGALLSLGQLVLAMGEPTTEQYPASLPSEQQAGEC